MGYDYGQRLWITRIEAKALEMSLSDSVKAKNSLLANLFLASCRDLINVTYKCNE